MSASPVEAAGVNKIVSGRVFLKQPRLAHLFVSGACSGMTVLRGTTFFGPTSRFLNAIIGIIVLSFLVAACGTSAQQANDGGGGGRFGGRGGRGGGRGGRGGTQPVVVAKVTSKDVPVEISAVGNVEAANLVQVRSQVTGVLEEVGFKEGDFVKKGQMLFSIDRRPLQSALQQAEANLVRDQALLNQAEAQMNR